MIVRSRKTGQWMKHMSKQQIADWNAAKFYVGGRDLADAVVRAWVESF